MRARHRQPFMVPGFILINAYRMAGFVTRAKPFEIYMAQADTATPQEVRCHLHYSNLPSFSIPHRLHKMLLAASYYNVKEWNIQGQIDLQDRINRVPGASRRDTVHGWSVTFPPADMGLINISFADDMSATTIDWFNNVPPHIAQHLQIPGAEPPPDDPRPETPDMMEDDDFREYQEMRAAAEALASLQSGL